jgi:RNA polymerase sigma-70 factor, ECF subfamily
MRSAPFASLKSLFTTTDEQAMWRVQTLDDAGAFAELVSRWQKPIQRLCTRMTGDTHRGEDLAQETFTRLFAQRKNYQPSGKFSSYVWRIALNLCYDELRRARRRNEASLENEQKDGFTILETQAAPEPGPDGRAVEEESAFLVRRALQQLSEAYRSVVVLRHYEDLKFREIAELLEIPEGTVKSRMAEALTQLSRLLRPALADERERRSESRRNTERKERLMI